MKLHVIVSILLLGSAAVLLAQENSFGATLGGSSLVGASSFRGPCLNLCRSGTCPMGYWCRFTGCGSSCVPFTIRPPVQFCNRSLPRVFCFVNPCQVSSCSVPNAQCRPCYHGGCKAIWYVGNMIVNC